MKARNILFCAFFIFYTSCKQTGGGINVISSEMKPIVSNANGYIVPADSSPVFTTYPALEPLIIKAGKPNITSAKNNIHFAGEPVVLDKEIPEKIIPGKNGLELPDTIAIELRKVPCLNKPSHKASLPAFVDDSDFNLRYVDVEQGLATSELLSILKDSRGNIWIGTNGEGVIKYDGSYITQYTTNEGLLNNYVRRILEDENGNIWFGTDEGLMKYNGYEFTWVVENGNSAGRMHIQSMVSDKLGNIWFGTFDAGLFKFDGSLLTRYNIKQGLNKSIYSIKEDSKGNLWFGANYTGIFKYDGKTFELYQQNNLLSGNRINCIEEDAEGNIWIGTTAGLSKFNQQFFTNYTKEQGLPFNYINCILPDNSGDMWIGTEGGGACKFDGKSFYYYTKKEGFRSNQISSIVQERSGITWFASFGGGVMILNEKGFTHFGSIPELNRSIIYTIYEDKNGNTWFGTQNGELIKFDGEAFYTYTQQEGFYGALVRDIIQDQKGDIWIAMQNGGLCRFNGNSFTYYNAQYSPMLSGAFSLYEDRMGNIWIGLLHRGIVKYDGRSFTHFKLKRENIYEDIPSILEDPKGNMWFSSMDGTVARFDGRNFTYYTLPDNDAAETLLNDSRGNIWMTGSNGSGITKYDGKKFYRFTENQGLSDNKTRSLVQDNRGNLWIGTKSGLNYFDNPAGMGDRPSRITQFGSANGMIGEDFQANAALIDSKGNGWWATSKSVNKLDLRFIDHDTSTPTVQLNTIQVNGSHVDFYHLHDDHSDSLQPSVPKKIKYLNTKAFHNYPMDPVIPFTLNHLAFHFNAIDWAAPGKLKYSYKIEGLDNKWSELSGETSADYRNIPYGNYVFKVKAIGAAQKWSNTFEYAFEISPPWWHSWWFRSLAAACFIASLYSFYLYRTKALRERQKYLQLTVEKRTEELRESLSEKEALLKEVHHRVKNNLEVISSLLMLQTKNMTDEKAKAGLTEGQSRVQSIALIHHKLYRTDEMGSVELCGFSADLFKQVKDVFNKPGTDVEFGINETEIWLHTDAAVPFGLILNELFTNAFKYAVEPERKNFISVLLKETIEGEKTLYSLVFRDSGRGLPADINMDTSTSLGMKVIRLLTRQLNGTSKFYNDNGTIFELNFPKKSISQNIPEIKKDI